MPAQQNDISALYFQKQTFAERIDDILNFIHQKSSFNVEKLLQKSSWWSSKTAGAYHYLGTMHNEPVILKIQGVKPAISEAENIRHFVAQNKSKLIRPPKIYWSMPWNEKYQFEALILEYLEGSKLVGLPATPEQIGQFFDVYSEYRKNCRNTPWLERPTASLSEGVQKAFFQWQKIADELSPNHPLRKPNDKALIQQAVDTLVREYAGVDWEFQHGHFSARDIFPKNGQYAVLSNLYWSWRAPYYDAVFGFHWYQCDLAAKEGTTIKMLEEHRERWKTAIYQATSPKTPKENRLLRLAFLERATAGLNLDAIIPLTPASEWLIGTLRREIEEYLAFLE